MGEGKFLLEEGIYANRETQIPLMPTRGECLAIACQSVAAFGQACVSIHGQSTEERKKGWVAFLERETNWSSQMFRAILSIYSEVSPIALKGACSHVRLQTCSGKEEDDRNISEQFLLVWESAVHVACSPNVVLSISRQGKPRVLHSPFF